MKFSLISVLVVFFAVMFLPTCTNTSEQEPETSPTPEIDLEAEEEAIRKKRERRLSAWNSHDITAIMALRDDTFESWEGPERPGGSTREGLSNYFESQKAIHFDIADEIGIVFVTPDVAIHKWRVGYSGEVDADGNALPPRTVLSAEVLVKRKTGWLIAARFNNQ